MMFAFIVSYVFKFVFFIHILDIDSLTVFLNHLYLIVSDSQTVVYENELYCLFMSLNISWISRVN